MFNFAPFVKLVELSKKETLTEEEAQHAKELVNSTLTSVLSDDKLAQILDKIDELTITE